MYTVTDVYYILRYTTDTAYKFRTRKTSSGKIHDTRLDSSLVFSFTTTDVRFTHVNVTTG
jgi:hypothetical protein